jgi:hypothetical protein
MAAAPDIFLSYNREDQAVARRFAEGFKREGLNVWWDVTLRSGEAYDQVTEQALVFNPRFNFALKDRAEYLEALGRRAEARDAVRRLRAIEAGVTLPLWKARHEQSLLAPETSTAMFDLLERAWLDTPEEPAQS